MDLLNPTKSIYQKWQQIQYYAIIAVVSLIALFFLPMLGTSVGLAWVVPNTVVGWIVYVITKLLVAGINILIFHCFILQGKLNIQHNEKYLEAKEILNQIEEKELIPRSPKEWHSQVYGKKSLTIFITSVISAVGLTQAILTFDWVSMLTYLFTIIMGLIFGILQMNQEEIYWTEEYYEYAKHTQKKALEREMAAVQEKSQDTPTSDMDVVAAEPTQQINDTTDDIGGSTVLVSPDNNGVPCDIC